MTQKKVSYDSEKGLIRLRKKSHMTQKKVSYDPPLTREFLPAFKGEAGEGGIEKLELYIFHLPNE